MAPLAELPAADGGLVIAFILLALKGFVVLALASVVGLALQRTTASLKHFCWAAAIAVLLALPVLEAALPAWTVPLLPGQAVEFGDPLATVVSDYAVVEDMGPAMAGNVADDAAPATLADERSNQGSAASLLLAIWAAGAGLVLLYMLAGTIGAWRMVTRARPVTDPEWLDLVDEMTDRLAIRRPIQLLETAKVRIPMVWGVARPAVVLPTDANEWGDERRRCVLAHELAHVKRLDAFTQSMVRIACALHWFNPLVWRAARAIRFEREIACDDFVLQTARTRPSEYASHLIDIARRVPPSFMQPAGALAMARRSQLEGRVLSILEERSRRPFRRIPALAGAFLAMLLVLPLAAFRPAPMEADAGRPAPMVADAGHEADAILLAVEVPVEAAMPPVMLSQPPAVAPEPAPQESPNGIDVIRRSFRVSDRGTLQIRTDQGNIEVRTGSSGTVDVEVHRTSYGRAAEEEFEVSFDQSGNVVRIDGDRNRNYNRGGSGIRVQFIVTVPRSFNVDLETSGGNVSLGDLDGGVEVKTAGGNLNFGHVTGKVNAHTSGGNISLDGSAGDVRVRTSGGNIRLGKVGGTVEARTSGGNINIDEVNGTIQAITSGGQISARIARQPGGDCRLETSGGSITVSLAPGIRANLDAETSAGRVVSDIDVVTRGEIKKNRLRGTINGGGPALILDTAAGDIRIRSL